MENSTYALVLTGDVLPGHAEETVWPALATYFRMDLDKLRTQLVARAPLAIKQGDDLGKLQTLQAGIAALGAEAEVCAPDERANLFVVLANTPRGPMPRVFVDDRIERGLWPMRLSVAEVGSSAWRPYSDFSTPPPAAPAEPPAQAFDENAFTSRDTTRAYKPTSKADYGHNLAAVATPTAVTPQPLPAGDTVHAGFWRRVAAALIDGLLIGIVLGAVQVGVGVGAVGSLATMNDAGAGMAAAIGSMLLFFVIAFVGQWLYFALFEAGAMQATPGKRALGLKVVDDVGARIGFGRATGRYFGKIVSGAIFYVGFLMAGFTERKQGLHDLMASTYVVFREVQPGEPMPAARPPMPWWGWLVNIVMLGLPIAAIAFALAMFPGVLASLHG
ncbi:MAG: RDD family protein [Dokdonella sp.]|uniref:RDD family protein n=1 Tax=Dokdonella sp. TaxID=2291710 RepID=UPI003F7E210D